VGNALDAVSDALSGKNYDCQSNVAADPSNPHVVEHELSVLGDLLAEYPLLSGINLDYIRYSSPPDPCYRGGDVTKDVEPHLWNVNSSAIVDFVKKVRTKFPNVILSADVLADAQTRTEVGQAGILQYVDIIMPMTYSYNPTGTALDIKNWVDEIKQEVPTKTILPILRGWTSGLPNPTAAGLISNFASDLAAVKTENTAGYAIFTYDELLRETGNSKLSVILAALGVANPSWSETYGSFDEFQSIKRTSDGGYALSTGLGCIVKVNSSGSVLWSYNSSIGDQFTLGVDALELADGTNVLAGTSMPVALPVRKAKIFLAKLNPNGKHLWTKLFARTNLDHPSAIQETSSGELVIAGQTAMQNMYLMKTDAGGNKLWEKVLGQGNLNSVEPTDSGFFLSGYTGSAGKPSAVVMKTDLGGNILWEKTFAVGPNTVRLSKTRGGGVIVATAYAGGELINLSENGAVRWNVTCGGSKDFFKRAVQTHDGGFIAIGTKFVSFPTTGDIWLVKLDDTGKMQWERTFGATGYNRGNAVLETPDGGFILAGGTGSTVKTGTAPAKFGKAWLIKTDENGNTN
jgi:hypothetical protein